MCLCFIVYTFLYKLTDTKQAFTLNLMPKYTIKLLITTQKIQKSHL